MKKLEEFAVKETETVNKVDADDIYFLIGTKEKECLIGLGNILECLKFAETEGEVPPIPKEWWKKMAEMYPQVADN